MLKISEEEKKALKGRGIIMTNDGEHFVARVVSSNGVFTAEQLRALTDAAEKYGDGTRRADRAPHGGNPGRQLREHRAAGRGGGGLRPRHRRHGQRRAPGRRLQGHGLRPRARGHAGVRRRALPRVLPRLAQREAAAQVQDCRRRLPEQLRQARAARLRRVRPERARAARRRVQGLRQVRLRREVSRQGLLEGRRRQARHRLGQVHQLRQVHPRLPFRRGAARSRARLRRVHRRHLGQDPAPRHPRPRRIQQGRGPLHGREGASCSSASRA